MYWFATPLTPRIRRGRRRIRMMYFEMLAGTQDPEEYNLNTKLAKEVDKMLSEGLSKAKSVQL